MSIIMEHRVLCNMMAPLDVCTDTNLLLITLMQPLGASLPATAVCPTWQGRRVALLIVCLSIALAIGVTLAASWGGLAQTRGGVEVLTLSKPLRTARPGSVTVSATRRHPPPALHVPWPRLHSAAVLPLPPPEVASLRAGLPRSPHGTPALVVGGAAVVAGVVVAFLRGPRSALASASGEAGGEPAVRLRPATAQDLPAIFQAMASEKMNPLFLKPKQFVVAETAVDGQFVGCGQIRPITATESELASLYVVPDWRGRGVGGRIVGQLLASFVSGGGRPASLYLLTLARTTPFYEPWGFEEVAPEALPGPMRGEFAVGRVVTRALGETLVGMRCVRG